MTRFTASCASTQATRVLFAAFYNALSSGTQAQINFPFLR